jgi:hypothetical protein
MNQHPDFDFQETNPIARVRGGALVKASNARNLRFALENFSNDDLPAALADAIKGNANALLILECAMNLLKKN